MKHEPVEHLKLIVQVLGGKALELRNPKQQSERTHLKGFCTCMGTVELVNGNEWFFPTHLRPYGTPIRMPSATIAPRDLKQAWDDEIVEVWRIRPDGTEEEFFDE